MTAVFRFIAIHSRKTEKKWNYSVKKCSLPLNKNISLNTTREHEVNCILQSGLSGKTECRLTTCVKVSMSLSVCSIMSCIFLTHTHFFCLKADDPSNWHPWRCSNRFLSHSLIVFWLYINYHSTESAKALTLWHDPAMLSNHSSLSLLPQQMWSWTPRPLWHKLNQVSENTGQTLMLWLLHCLKDVLSSLQVLSGDNMFW